MVGITIVCTLYIMSSVVLMVYGLQCYIMTLLYLRARKVKLPLQRAKIAAYAANFNPTQCPTVVTQLPMYNEKAVAVRIIEAAAAIDYPRDRHEIQVIDDSTDETRDYVDNTVGRLRGQGVHISVVRRTNRQGYKAGALQNALNHTKAEFVAIFDADFIPPRDFLKKAIAFFVDDEKLGLVQGRWAHLNRDASLITRGQAFGIDGHFMIEQAARSWNNLFMNFNGTAGIFRRTAIETSGGWHHDTLTEDMDLSYRMQLHGWKTEYVPDIEVPAEIPEDVNAFKNQQFRWAKGSIQTALKIIPQLRNNPIPRFKLFQAVLHLTHYAVHPFMLLLALLTLPVLYFVNWSLPPLFFAPIIVAMLLSTSGPSTMYVVAQHFLGNRKWKFFPMVPIMMVIGVGLAINNTKAVVEALAGRDSPFHRTPKKGEGKAKGAGYRPIKDITCLLELLMGVYCMIGFGLFVTSTNVFVTPFLVMYACGFLFVGAVSILHYRRPEWIDLKVPFLRPARAAA